MNELIILNKCKDLINYIDLYVFSSFTKSKRSLKIKFENELYTLLNNILHANFNYGNIRKKYIKEAIVNVALMDIYIGFVYSNNIIIKKRFLSIVNKLSEIRKMLYGWINEEIK